MQDKNAVSGKSIAIVAKPGNQAQYQSQRMKRKFSARRFNIPKNRYIFEKKKLMCNNQEKVQKNTTAPVNIKNLKSNTLDYMYLKP